MSLTLDLTMLTLDRAQPLRQARPGSKPLIIKLGLGRLADTSHRVTIVTCDVTDVCVQMIIPNNTYRLQQASNICIIFAYI
jgi:hypothetical protein